MPSLRFGPPGGAVANAVSYASSQWIEADLNVFQSLSLQLKSGIRVTPPYRPDAYSMPSV